MIGSRGSSFTSTERKVLHVLELKGAGYGWVEMTKGELGVLCGRSPRAVDSAVRSLRESGVMLCECRYREDGGRAGNAYRLNSTDMLGEVGPARFFL